MDWNLSSKKNSKITVLDSTKIWSVSSCSDFKKAVHEILEWENIRNILMTKMNEVPNFSRVYLLRHLSVNEKEFGEYSQLREEWRKDKKNMSSGNINRMDYLDNNMEIELPTDADMRFYRDVLGNDCILYIDLETQVKTRNKRTLEWIDTNLIQPGYLKCEVRPRDLYSDKNLTFGETTLKTGFQLCWINTEIKEQLLGSPNSLKWKNIIILSNSSFAHSFKILWGNRSFSPKSWSDTFRENDYDYFDIDENWNPIENDGLPITPNNYEDICQFFSIKKGGLTIVQIQNGLNNFLTEFKETWGKLYFSFLVDLFLSKQEELRVYAIREFIDQGKYEIIKRGYLLDNFLWLSKKEIALMFQYGKKWSQIQSEVFKIINLLYIRYPNKDCTLEHIDDIPEVFKSFSKDLQIQQVHERLIQNRLTYWKAVKIQARSLDETIKQWAAGAILNLDIRYPGIDNKFNAEWRVDTNTIIQSPDSYILPAVVGSGKSLWSTELAKKIACEYPEKRVVFFEGGDWVGKSIDDIRRDLHEKIRYTSNTVLIIDAFDEIGADAQTRDEILKILRKDWGNIKTIITGRPSEFHETDNTPFKTLRLEFSLFGIDKFIERKGGTNKEKIFELLQNSSLKYELFDNPLLLFFVCELANNYEQYGDLDILSLQEIIDISNTPNKALKPVLYENIIKLVIVKHEQRKPKNVRMFGSNKRKNLKRFQKIFYNLSQFALWLTLGKTYKEILNEYDWDDISQEDFFDAINILFKKENGDNYQFVHKSFQEYFSYQYRNNCLDGDTEWRKEWNQLLLRERNGNINELLGNIGLMNFSQFEQDVIYLMEQKEDIPLIEILKSILKTRDMKVHALLEKIVDMNNFKRSPEAIDIFCRVMAKTENIDGYALLEKIVDLDAFKGNPEAIDNLCSAVYNIKDPRGYVLLEKIVNLDAFKENSRAIKHFCLTIWLLKVPNGYALLEKVVDLNAFKESSRAIENFCSAIGHIGKPDGYALLEKVMELEAFKKDWSAIEHFCSAIANIRDPNGHVLLEKIVELDAFKKSSMAIDSFCLAIERMEDPNGHVLLEKIVELDAFRENPWGPIIMFCRAAGVIKNTEKYTLLEKIVDLDVFKESPWAIEHFCATIYTLKSTEGLTLLEKIVGLDAFRENKESVMHFCGAIMVMKDKEWCALLEKVVKLDAFKENPDSISYLCTALRITRDPRGYILLEKIANWNLLKGNSSAIKNILIYLLNIPKQEALFLLYQIEDSISGMPKLFRNAAYIYGWHGDRTMALMYLNRHLEYVWEKSPEKLKEQLNKINKSTFFVNMKDITEFQNLIQTYENLLQTL